MSVLHNMDLQPTVTGVVLISPVPVLVSWAQCRQALAGTDPESDDGRKRLARWLFARRWIAQVSLAELSERARPVGLPIDHALHPGPAWAREHVLGGTLDLGLGIAGPGSGEPDAIVVAPDVWAAAHIDPTPLWPLACAYLEKMSRLAAQRWRQSPRSVLRPMGDCDVVTLLASHGYRTTLAATYGGLATLAVPMRTRGWADLRAIDPAFAVVAAAATDEEERGFTSALLVTADEVVKVTKVSGSGQPSTGA